MEHPAQVDTNLAAKDVVEALLEERESHCADLLRSMGSLPNVEKVAQSYYQADGVAGLVRTKDGQAYEVVIRPASLSKADPIRSFTKRSEKREKRKQMFKDRRRNLWWRHESTHGTPSPTDLDRITNSVSQVSPDSEDEGEPGPVVKPAGIYSPGSQVQWNGKNYRVARVIGSSLVLQPGNVSVFSDQVRPID